jgi:hypothetical protein
MTHVQAMARFGRQLVESEDVDPIYPVLRHIYAQRGLSAERKHWQTALYVAYYNLPSALAAFRRWENVGTHLPKDAATYPCAVERRGLRGGKVVAYINEMVDKIFRPLGGGKYWSQKGWTDDEQENFRLFTAQVMSLNGNGRWAAFKWAELLKKVHGYPLAAPDMCLEHCSGPRDGLRMVYGLPSSTPTEELNKYSLRLWEELQAEGFEPADWEQLETVLCNYHSYAHGKYYVGHDIDEMLEATEVRWLSSYDRVAILEARAATIPHKYLKEFKR